MRWYSLNNLFATAFVGGDPCLMSCIALTFSRRALSSMSILMPSPFSTVTLEHFELATSMTSISLTPQSILFLTRCAAAFGRKLTSFPSRSLIYDRPNGCSRAAISNDSSHEHHKQRNYQRMRDVHVPTTAFSSEYYSSLSSKNGSGGGDIVHVDTGDSDRTPSTKNSYLGEVRDHRTTIARTTDTTTKPTSPPTHPRL